MEWGQFAIFIVSVLGIYWTTRQDINSIRAESSADRRDMLQLVRSIEAEIKDFHGRLCSIEERNKK